MNMRTNSPEFCTHSIPAVALGAPMLISLGHPKFESVVVLLLANTFATVFGAAGTPIWYGFGSLGLSEEDFKQISSYAALSLVVCAYFLVPFVFAVVVPLQMIKENLPFLLLALSGVMLPLLGISFVSYEFPSLIGGLVGLGASAALVRFRVGMKDVDHEEVLKESGRHLLDLAPVSDRSAVHSSSAFMTSMKVPPSLEEEEEGMHPLIDDIEEESDYTPLTRPGDIGAGGSSTNYSLMGDESGDSGKDPGTTQTTNLVSTSSSIEGMTDSQRAVEMAIGPRKKGGAYAKEFLLRTSPIYLTVFILILTRTPQIGINELLKSTSPYFAIYFGTYGTFKLSASLVFQLESILTYPNLNWKYELLYTPFLIPFVLVSVITYLLYKDEASDSILGIFGTVYSRVKSPALALAGALTLVQLMVVGEDESAPATIIGIVLSDAFGAGWVAVAAAIGALGSFFSGSTTVSNLTFGSVQQIAAEAIGANSNAMLALQVAGASAGNGICLNNIISACAVTGLAIGEGKVIAKTAKFVLAFIVLATLILLAFLL